MNHSLFISVMAAALLLTACDKSSENKTSGNANGETEVVVDVTPAVPSKDELTNLLINANLNDKIQLMSNSRSFVENYGIRDAQDISNAMWSGSDGFERNRPVSGAISIAAFEKTPQAWSALRSGIAYTNGLGIEKDASKAISILSMDMLSENVAAQYFLAKAYELNGQEEMYRSQLQKAADMGHEVAKKEIQG